MTSTLIGSGGQGAQTAGLIKESSEASFMTDVIEQSKSVPVLVDFWAPWCGPCKQLGPAIEKIVTEYAGKVKLVKINVDQNQGIASQMRVQSIPAVFAFADGKPVDGFMGALPEGQIRAFIDKVLKANGSGNDQLDEIFAQAENLLKQEKIEEAIQLYTAILGQLPDNLKAVAGLARAHMANNDLEAASDILEKAGKTDDPDIASARAALALAQTPAGEDEIERLKSRIASDPDDFESRFELANALNNAGDREAATDNLIYILKKNRGWNDEAARKQLLTYFQAWGIQDKASVEGRKKLSSVLFS